MNKSKVHEINKRDKIIGSIVIIMTLFGLLLILNACSNNGDSIEDNNSQINTIANSTMNKRKDTGKSSSLIDIDKKSSINNETEIDENKLKEDDSIIVEIKGQVNKPGVYSIKTQARLFELIDKAGGLKKDAVTDNINMARKLEDGEVILIPDRTQVTSINEEKENKDSITKSSSQKVNINTATQEELEAIPGIGKVTASGIIEYRKKKGKFKRIEDIKNVDRIGEKTFEKLKQYIKI